MAAAAPNIDEPQRADQLRRRANRRLLGARVLLLIAIVAVPMFLEREPPPLPDNVDVRIPVEGTKFDPKFPDGKAAADKPAGDRLDQRVDWCRAGAPVRQRSRDAGCSEPQLLRPPFLTRLRPRWQMTSPAKPATATPATKVAEKPAEKSADQEG